MLFINFAVSSVYWSHSRHSKRMKAFQLEPFFIRNFPKDREKSRKRYERMSTDSSLYEEIILTETWDQIKIIFQVNYELKEFSDSFIFYSFINFFNYSVMYFDILLLWCIAFNIK